MKRSAAVTKQGPAQAAMADTAQPPRACLCAHPQGGRTGLTTSLPGRDVLVRKAQMKASAERDSRLSSGMCLNHLTPAPGLPVVNSAFLRGRTVLSLVFSANTWQLVYVPLQRVNRAVSACPACERCRPALST